MTRTRESRRPDPRRLVVLILVLGLVAGVTGGCADGGVHVRVGARPLAHLTPAVVDAGTTSGGWVGSWEAAPSAATGLLRHGATVRDVLHTSVGGSRLRVWLTNEFGTRPLPVAHVTVALPAAPDSAAALPGTVREVTFGGRPGVTVAPGADLVGDPVAMAVPAGTDLLVSVFVGATSDTATYHPFAQQTSYYTGDADHSADLASTAFVRQTNDWFYVDGVDVDDPVARGSVVAFGDSITDGLRSSPNTNQRWPDYLAGRMLALPAARQCGVLNAGISGNRLLLGGSTPGGPGASAGPPGVARFDHDVLGRTDVRTVIVLEGVNDITESPRQPDAQDVIDGLLDMVEQAHAVGIRVIGATITPFQGRPAYDAATEAVREQVNTWIRDSHTFDEVVDFDAVLRDPADPHRLLPAYDSGDHLHPDDAGDHALASALDLADLCR